MCWFSSVITLVLDIECIHFSTGGSRFGAKFSMDLTTDSVQKKQKICEEFKDGNPPFAFVWSGRGRSGCCCFSRLHYETGVYGCEPLYGDYTGVWTAIILRLTEKEEWREVRGEGLGRSDRQPV